MIRARILQALGFLLAINFTQLASADDTEIYVSNTNSSGVRPNILFIMDSSGSMGNDAPVVRNPYDPNENYSGSYSRSQYYLDYGSYYSAVDVDCTSIENTLDSTGVFTGNVILAYRRSGRRWVIDEVKCDGTPSTWTEVRDSVSLWSGNYLNYQNDTSSGTQSRITVARQAFSDVIAGLSDVNAGLMHFNYEEGGLVAVPVKPIEDVRTDLINTVNNIAIDDWTPLSETVYEAMLYYKGDDVLYGGSSSSDSYTSSGGQKTYISPISQSCQNNHIVLFTDGVARKDESADSRIQNLLSGVTSNRPIDLSSNCSHNYSSGTLHDTCLEELSFSLNNGDYSTLDGNQNIQLYTIGGFDLGQTDFLERTATLGGGQYFAANSASQIVTSLTEILDDILSVNTTFTAPAVSVNAFNTSEHRDELFYALFRPEKNIKWAGNLKKYRITDNGIVLGQRDGIPAISESTGFFNEGIFDLWNNTSKADGKDIELGGFANRLDPSSRKIFTNHSGSLVELEDLTTAQQKVYYADSTLTDPETEDLTEWVYGEDVNDLDGDGSTTDSRNSIGDPLHSEPLIITYGGTDESPDASIFFGTNEGFLHSLKTDTDTVTEHFAFIPNELLSNQDDYYENSAASVSKPYGMDGLISAWVKDVNQDNLVLDPDGSVQDGEHIYLYAGMRRGGSSYYALDVTDRSNPELLFEITGGTGNFAKLGQTWSKMTIAKVKWNGTSRFVAFFSGGYDDDQDNNTTKAADDIGNAIYMIDATTGQRLWWASNSGANTNITQMTNSIPASISAVDISGDGHIDYFFAADTGGRVFRIDINQENTEASNFAVGGVIASLSGTETTDNRRFYNKPDVSIIKDKNEGDHLVISIGSGHRAFPISTTAVENRMYVIHDFSPYAAPTSYVTVSEAPTTKTTLDDDEVPDPTKLYNATALMKGGTMTADYQQLLKKGAGWYITFDSEGEKVLSESITFSGALIFTTFTPTGESTSVCGPDKGVSSVYALNLEWATPIIDLDGDGDIDEEDGKSALAHSGIAPRPVVIFRSDGGKTIAIGTETVEDSRFKATECTGDDCPEDENLYCKVDCVVPQYWRQNEKIIKSESE